MDCTLRDGGYYTNWDFDKNIVKNYYEAMEELPIKYVEIGYRSMPLPGYLGEFFYCPEATMRTAKEAMPSKKLAIILNEKDVKVENLDYLLDPCKPYIDLVRVAVDPANIERAIVLANGIKEKGFSVAFNIMYMSNWLSDNTFLQKISGVNGIVDYLYMVDSFGGVTPEEVHQISELLKSKTSVKLGFHGHNNIEMGLINSITAAKAGCELIDSTIMGMGRGAGNLKTELLLTYLSVRASWQISFQGLGTVISDFEELHKKYAWGTSLPYMISGSNSLPQKDVMSWIAKRRYSINGIVNALHNQKENVSDNLKLPKFEEEVSGDTAIIIGGGVSIPQHEQAIKNVISLSESNFVLIHAGTRYASIFAETPIRQYYCMVGNEGYKLKQSLEKLTTLKYKCILPPYPRKMGTYIPDEIKKAAYELKEINFTDKFHDSPLSIAIQCALELNMDKFIFVGFDGYDTELNATQVELTQENQYVFDQLQKVKTDCISWTATKYKNLKERSLYSYLH